jgi:short-subunit dehydrogenase
VRPKSIGDLHGISAIVTGASAGIGSAFAHELARRGASRIVLVARRENRLRALASALGPVAEVRVADLSKPDEVAQLIEAVGPVDLLINNAGFGWATGFSDQRFPRLGQMIDLNCRGLVQLTHGCLPPMLEQGRGWILNVGSTAGLVPTPKLAVYAASKAFVNHFTEALRIELQGTGVCVHLLAPGPVDTEFFAVARPEKDPESERPMGFLFEGAEAVARQALDAMLADKARSIPGRPIRWAFGLAAILPLSVIRPLVGLGAHGLDRLLNKEDSHGR